MAISFWKCLENKESRAKLRQRSSNVQKKLAVESPKYQNSFRLDAHQPFRIDPVDLIVRTVMEYRFEDITYDMNTTPPLCSQVAAEIRKKIMNLHFDRYKIVVFVTIVEKTSQSIDSVCGFLWDVKKDNYSTYTFENQSFFAYCFVGGIYHE
ncbi:GSCOCG00007914001-RA-CDS [Cotesia congregata]|nr:GSCOCG00007914001-RA-CDS [Cotesia congregata]